jgi:hypothetical protein
MNRYAILRRDGWAHQEELSQAATRSSSVVEEEMPDDVHWIRSYVLDEGGGAVGTVCIFEATSVAALRLHATAARLPVTEIIPLLETVVIRPDP